MRIKVCGMREPENIAAVSRLPINYMGFIFYAPSPRNCIENIGRDTLSHLPDEVRPVAVAVNMGEDEIVSLADRYGFDTFQLHGDESPELCRSLRRRGFIVIKALGIKDRDDLRKAEPYSDNVDYFLFDTATKARGGSGKKFDWAVLDGYSLSVPFFLSGGIGPDDLAEIEAFNHPCFEGIDLNSKFELSPGIKNVDALAAFIEKIDRL